jgi:hypothetical protein
MGYEVHITRKTNWSDSDGPRITEDEWKVYVASDPEMVLTGVAEHTNPQGETIRVSHPLLTEWRRHSSRLPVWFSYSKGNVSVKNPDEECLAKIRKVAAHLHARIQGDDGEIYGEDNEPTKSPTLSCGARMKRWFAYLRPQRPLKLEHKPLPFDVGDRVRDVWGNQHTVIAIDPRTEHGTGVIRTRRDDGTELFHMMIAHGLTPITQRDKP